MRMSLPRIQNGLGTLVAALAGHMQEGTRARNPRIPAIFARESYVLGATTRAGKDFLGMTGLDR